MGETNAIQVPKIRFYQPERNLPGRKARVTTREDRFTISFAKAYFEQAHSLHHGTLKNELACARQIAVNGLGIADLVAIAWPPGKHEQRYANIEEFVTASNPTIRAFEVKLGNWRKGMIQAHRYRYYANAAVLILPTDKCAAAIPYLATFRRIHVGLWGFDTATNRIYPHYTPRPSAAIEPKYRMKVLQVIASTPKSLPIRGKV